MVKTVTLAADTPQKVTFEGAYPYYWIDNKTASDVYASVGVPEADADGTYTVAAGSQMRISGGVGNDGITLLGEGKVQIIASAIAACPFKSAAGGGDANAKYIDGVPVDLTGMYNTQVIGYDEASSKLVPMITYSKTQTIFPSTASPKVYEVVDQINITRIIELGNGIRAYSSSENESDPAIFAIRFGPIMLSEYTNLFVDVADYVNEYNVQISKNPDFSAIDAEYIKSSNGDLNCNIANLKGNYYIKIELRNWQKDKFMTLEGLKLS